MEWEEKIEQIWMCHHFPELRKVQLAALVFTSYAMKWWSHLLRERRHYNEPPIETWAEMRAHLRTRFVPQHYSRELKKRLALNNTP